MPPENMTQVATVQTNTGVQQVPVPANCVSVCPPVKDMLNPGRYAVNDMAQMEAVSWPLYDYQLYPAAGVATMTFFQTPVGQSSKTEEDTNMVSAGQLPAPQKYLIQGMGIDYLPGSAPSQYGTGATIVPKAQINDVYAILRRGVAKLTIGSKDYAMFAPLGFAPPRSHINGGQALSDATTAAAALTGMISFGYWDGDVWNPTPLLLEASQNFKVTIAWPGGVVAVPSADALARIGCVLYGTLYRPPQ